MRSLHQQDKDLIWHPYTQHLVEPQPLVIERAKGHPFILLTEKKFRPHFKLVDYTHGHSHEKLNQVLIDQAEKLEHVMFAGFSHRPAIQLATKLVKMLPIT